MAETTWAEEAPSAPPKKSIPTWVWFCGAGCLAVLLLALIAGIFLFKAVKTATDPEAHWPRIAQILPFDERPPELRLILGATFPVEQYQFEDTRGFRVTLQHHSGKDARETRKQMFESDKPKFPDNLGPVKFEDVQPVSIEVQGRELRALRLRMQFTGLMKKFVPKEVQDQMGSMMFVDATPEGSDDLLFLQLARLHGSEPISDEELRTFLKPFHIGPKR